MCDTECSTNAAVEVYGYAWHMPMSKQQVFRDTKNTQKSQKLKTKWQTWKSAERVTATQNKKYS